MKENARCMRMLLTEFQSCTAKISVAGKEDLTLNKYRAKVSFIAFILLFLFSGFHPGFSAEKKDKKKEPEKPLTIERIISISPNYNYDLSPDGKELLFVNDKDGYSTIFKMKTVGGVPTQVTGQMQSFSNPRWSPDGKKIVCESEDQIWVMDADGRNPKKLTEHGAGAKHPRWSPDGKTIAYYSRRKGWNQIWLMDADGGNKRRLIHIPNDFSSIAWSPDGKLIAASVEDMDNLYDSHIYVFPVDGSEPRKITPDNGCYDWEPRFTSDGKYIVFLSNRDGWDHLWRMNPDGSNPVKLSRGNYEHEDVFPSPDGKWVAYRRDVKGTRQLMVVSIDGGEPIRVNSSQKGIVFIESWSPDSKKIVAQFGSPVEPWGLWIYDVESRKGKNVVSSFVQGLKKSDFPQPEYVSFKARDGLTIHGYLLKLDKLEKGKKYPAIVYSHGGPTWQFGYRWRPFLAYLVQEGYIVLGIDYRGSTGYGVKFQKANDGEWGNKDMFDHVDAKKYLASLDFIDPEKIAVYGGSYGGYMTLCCMTRAAGEFACGIALYGDSDIAESYKHGDRPGRLDLKMQMGDPEENEEIYKRGSPVNYVENVQDPILIQHGKEDMRVVPLMSELMIEKLKIEGKFYKAKFFEDEPHGFYKPENLKVSYQMIYDFLEKYLKNSEEEE